MFKYHYSISNALNPVVPVYSGTHEHEGQKIGGTFMSHYYPK